MYITCSTALYQNIEDIYKAFDLIVVGTVVLNCFPNVSLGYSLLMGVVRSKKIIIVIYQLHDS